MTVQERIQGRKIGVIGMARSGIAAALLARELGGEPFVSDSASKEHLRDRLEQLRQAGLEFETGAHSDRLLESDYVILSPGVPPQVEIVKKIEARGIPIFSEIEFASWVCRGRIVGVTGSNGKTTTTTLLGAILEAAKLDTFVCGNIGLPFAQVADKVHAEAVAVVEISTFQLERIADLHPQVALILNLSPDHLDRHGTYEAYRRLKYRITENQTAEDCLILNLEDEDTVRDDPSTAAEKMYFCTRDYSRAAAFVRDGILWIRTDGREKAVLPTDQIGIPGPHNLQNSAAAAVAAGRLGVSADVMAEVLRTFPGVEHRLEKVDRVAGIDFVNDSKATNVDSVCYALRSIDGPIYLIAGGRGKGSSYEPIARYGRDKIKGLLLIGEARDQIFAELGKTFSTQFADSLEDAVRRAFDLAHPGDTVLLSPGCASFDMFQDFEHRGRAFKQAVNALKNGNRTHETIND